MVERRENVMKKILNIMAKIGMKSAIKASNAASMFGCYQPKEPLTLKKLKKLKWDAA